MQQKNGSVMVGFDRRESVTITHLIVVHLVVSLLLAGCKDDPQRQRKTKKTAPAERPPSSRKPDRSKAKAAAATRESLAYRPLLNQPGHTMSRVSFIGWSVSGLKSEAIGELTISLPAARVLALLGKPKERDEVTFEPATADHVQTWRYPSTACRSPCAATASAASNRSPA